MPRVVLEQALLLFREGALETPDEDIEEAQQAFLKELEAQMKSIPKQGITN